MNTCRGRYSFLVMRLEEVREFYLHSAVESYVETILKENFCPK